VEPRHADALRRVFEADRTWTSEGHEPEQFHLRHSGGMKSHIDHPRWDSSWAVPSEHTIDDLDEMEFLRVEPHHDMARSFGLTLKGRTRGAEIAARGSAITATTRDGSKSETGPRLADSRGTVPGGEEPDAPPHVFIVHGHSREHEVARAVQEMTGREPILLSEQPGRGQTIIEKFEANAGKAGFAVVLLTADDIGASKGESESLNPRARQNAILELGYFIARIGRENVAVLYEADVELPSDYTGVEYISFAGDWRWKLQRELDDAGLGAEAPTN
jgi:hypothetical protein